MTLIIIRVIRAHSYIRVEFMAKKSTIARSNKKPKFSSRLVRRCFLCGRKGGYIREFDLCRIHFRELASDGLLPGIKKSSW
jgi:small subunit ribosomal protein S14